MINEKFPAFNKDVSMENQKNSEEAWPMTDKDEDDFLDSLALNDAILICNQLETLGETNPKAAASGYRYVLEKYPNHPNKEKWQVKLNEWSERE